MLSHVNIDMFDKTAKTDSGEAARCISLNFAWIAMAAIIIGENRNKHIAKTRIGRLPRFQSTAANAKLAVIVALNAIF